jgi:hypothetical protein
MKFSVVIPLYNKEHYIEKTIQSVLDQTCTDYEVIVVDDGSKDNSLALARKFESDRVRVIPQENQGVSVARNTGILNANGEFICFLDADDEWRPDYLATVEQLTERYPESAIFVTAYAVNMGNGKINYSTRLEPETGLLPSFIGKQYWNFYSWNPGLGGLEKFLETAPYECAMNAFASDSFRCFARLCDVVQPELAAHYDDLHAKLNENLHKAFFDPERNVYMARTDGANPTLYTFLQVLPLYVGATPKELRATVIENMLKPEMVPCMLSARTYEYDVLLQEDDKYREFVRRDVEETWGYMLFQGATSFWEVAAIKNTDIFSFSQDGSLCHGWSGMPIYLYGKYNLLNE